MDLIKQIALKQKFASPAKYSNEHRASGLRTKIYRVRNIK